MALVIAALIFGLFMERRKYSNRIRPESTRKVDHIMKARSDAHVYLNSTNLFKEAPENESIEVFNGTNESLSEM